eukprot:g170.t1
MSEADSDNRLLADLSRFHSVEDVTDEDEVSSVDNVVSSDDPDESSSEKKNSDKEQELFADLFGASARTNSNMREVRESKLPIDNGEEEVEEKKRRAERRRRRALRKSKKDGPKLHLRIRARTTSSVKGNKAEGRGHTGDDDDDDDDEGGGRGGDKNQGKGKLPNTGVSNSNGSSIADASGPASLGSTTKASSDGVRATPAKSGGADSRRRPDDLRIRSVREENASNVLDKDPSNYRAFLIERIRALLQKMKRTKKSAERRALRSRLQELTRSLKAFNRSSGVRTESKREDFRVDSGSCGYFVASHTVEHCANIILRTALHEHQYLCAHALTDIASAFAAFDTQGNGLLEPAEFAAAIDQLDYGIPSCDIMDITRNLLASSCAVEGKINFIDFLSTMEHSSKRIDRKRSPRRKHTPSSDPRPDFHPSEWGGMIEFESEPPSPPPRDSDSKYVARGSEEDVDCNFPGRLAGVPAPSPPPSRTLTLGASLGGVSSVDAPERAVSSSFTNAVEWERKAEKCASKDLVSNIRNISDQGDAADAILNAMPSLPARASIDKDVPKTRTSEIGIQHISRRAPPRRAEYAVAIEKYDGSAMPGHLTLNIGDVVEILRDKGNGEDCDMTFGRKPGLAPGLFPSNCAEKRDVAKRDVDPVWHFLRQNWLEGYYDLMRNYLGVATMDDIASFLTKEHLESIDMRPVEILKMVRAIDRLRGVTRSENTTRRSSASETNIAGTVVVDGVVEGNELGIDSDGAGVEDDEEDWERRLEELRGNDRAGITEGGGGFAALGDRMRGSE